jgi:putative ABC transport system permease protein
MRWRWRREDREKQLTRELDDHLDLDAEERQATGEPTPEARRAARLSFGNPAVIREGVREAWGWMWLERLRLDVVRWPSYRDGAHVTWCVAARADDSARSRRAARQCLHVRRDHRRRIARASATAGAIVVGVLIGFGTITLFVCCLGIYGMLSSAVARRRSEISIRMAIGAQTSHVVRSVVRESVLAVGVGAIAGTLASIAMTQWLQTLLFGVSSVDPMALGGAAGVFLTVAGLAAAIPARAASRVDPVLALRQ